jgi:class 3 adenylate cyclase
MNATKIRPSSLRQRRSCVRITTEVLLVVDEVDSTGRMLDLGCEEAYREQRRLDRLVDTTVRSHRGSVDHWCGDGAIARFPCVASATDAGLRLVATAADATSHRSDRPIRLRAATHIDEVLIDHQERSFGLGLVVAVRICGVAAGGSVVVSAPVAEVLGADGWRLDELGPAHLKGMPDPVELWRVAGSTC